MKTAETTRTIWLDCLRHVMWPFVRFCIRRSYSFQDFSKISKVVFIQAAEEEILRSGDKVNVSRISAITGIYRDEVTKIYREKELPTTEPLSVLGRVLGHWEQDPHFTTKVGKPRILGYEGKDSEFQQLVESVSKHLNPGTILFELGRIGAVEKTTKGLKRTHQLAGVDIDPRTGFELLAQDLDSLLSAGEENLTTDCPISNLHIRTEYDNVLKSKLPEIRKWFISEGKSFHRKARDFLSRYDQDIHPIPDEEGGAKVSMTAFSFTTKLPQGRSKKA